jgi:hypothetical protein
MTGIIAGNVFAMGTIDITFDPAEVAAATTAEQSITVPGIKVGDLVFVRKPTLSAGLGIAGARVSGNNTVAVTFINATAAPINAGSEVYQILWVRPEGAVGAAISA